MLLSLRELKSGIRPKFKLNCLRIVAKKESNVDIFNSLAKKSAINLSLSAKTSSFDIPKSSQIAFRSPSHLLESRLQNVSVILCFISFAALFVNVRARILLG